MSIRSQEEQLFSVWSSGRADFVTDGLADERLYLESETKLLFVLKEVNDLGGGGWDLREFVRCGGRAQTWNNITRWVEGIRNLPRDLTWESLETVDEPRRQAALPSIAAINLRKSPGGHTTDAARLAEDAEEDREFINRQVALYDPDYVICCGTSDLFHFLVEFPKPPEWKRTARGVWYHEPIARKYVIAYSHPEARCASYLLHYGLVDAIREIGAYAT